MAGRDPLPGEHGAYGRTRDHELYLSRTARGQITNVTPDEGRAQVATIDIIGERSVTVPPMWFSSVEGKTSWGRYMPMGGESVNVTYRNDGSAVVSGYDLNNSSGKTNTAGWQTLKRFEEEATGQSGNTRNSQLSQFASFRKLRRGEYDFKSAGDAYIHGSNQGTLFLAGGQAYIKLVKNAYRIQSKASEKSFTSETSQIRFGTVFRTALITDQDESPVSGGIYKEFLVDLNQAQATGIPSPQSKARIHFGDILDSTNTPELGQSGQALRGRISIGGSDNITEVFNLEIDQLGNVNIVSGTNALDGWTASAPQFTFNSTGQSNGTGGLLNITSGNINLGGLSPQNKAVLWDPGLRQELDGIQQALSDLAKDLKEHSHPLPFQSLGIPTGEILQTIQTKFVGSNDAGFRIVEPVQKLGEVCKSNSGPMTLVSGLGEVNELDSAKPRETGGFFRNEYSASDVSSSIVNIES